MTTEATAAQTEAAQQPAVVTRDDLVRLHACSEQRILFSAVFGESVEVTEENVRKALNAGLDVGWLAHQMSQPYERAFCANVCMRFSGRERESAYETALITTFVRLYTAQARGEPVPNDLIPQEPTE